MLMFIARDGLVHIIISEIGGDMSQYRFNLWNHLSLYVCTFLLFFKNEAK